MSAPRGRLGAEAKITAPGIYSVPAEVYHADKLLPVPSLSSSGARKILATCPARYWYERQNPPPPSDALVTGSAAHEWLLEGDTWPQRHGVLPEDHNGATKAGKEAVAAIEAEGKRPIKHHVFGQIQAMRDALLAHPLASAAFQNGKAEQSLYWRDEQRGIWCRARPDWTPNGGSIIADYKTCTEASDEHLRKDIANFGYHVQAAWYCDGLKALNIIDAPVFLFVFQEKAPPYLVRCITLDDETLAWGDALAAQARTIFAGCLRSGHWPGYSDDIDALGLPGWHRARLQHDVDLGRLAVEFQAPHGWKDEAA